MQDILDIIESALNLSGMGEVMAGNTEDSLTFCATNGEKYIITVAKK